MAFVNVWNCHATFFELLLVSCLAAFSWVAMMAPMKAMKAPKSKAKARAEGQANKKRKKEEAEEVKDDDDDFDPEAMTAADKTCQA